MILVVQMFDEDRGEGIEVERLALEEVVETEEDGDPLLTAREEVSVVEQMGQPEADLERVALVAAERVEPGRDRVQTVMVHKVQAEQGQQVAQLTGRDVHFSSTSKMDD